MNHLNADFCIDGITAPTMNFHGASVQSGAASVFVHVGPVTVWSREPAAFRRIAEALLEAARQLDAVPQAEDSPAVEATA